MSIKGDMVGHAARKTKVPAKIVREVLEVALRGVHEDPNFAFRYAAWFLEENGIDPQLTKAVGGSEEGARTAKYLEFLDVIQFLIDHL